MCKMQRPDEDVNGIVIGEVSAIYAELHYAGRLQRKGFWVSSPDQAITAAKELKSRINLDMGDAYCMIYPENALWEVRIY